MTDHDRFIDRPEIRRLGRTVVTAITAAPPLILAVAAVAGIGLERGGSAFASFASATAVVCLPVLGLTIGRRWGRAIQASACWIWSLAILFAVPVYVPGERRTATERGLHSATGVFGERVAEAIARVGGGIVGGLGEDAKPSRAIAKRAEPVASEAHTPQPDSAPTATLQGESSEPRAPATVRLPYEGDQTSLRVQVDVDGPVVGERVEMIFDTGATFTTLDRSTLARLEVAIRHDAPRITLRTANGPIEAPLVLVDAIWLGDVPVEWVTVAVCDSCVNPPAVGLLGLNVSQRFRVALDHDRRRIELAPRSRRPNRVLDIRQWLSIRSMATRDWTGSVDVALEATNRSHQPIGEAVVDLTCGTETFAIQIDDIPALGGRSTEITLPRGVDCSEQHIEVSRATWVHDRF